MNPTAGTIREQIDKLIADRMTLILSEGDVRRVLDFKACVELQAQAYRAFSDGNVVVPQRLRIPVPAHAGNTSYMPGYVPDVSGLACKAVSGFAGNSDYGLPSTMGSVTLLDDVTGFPLAFMGATYLTNARTGAGGAAAAKALLKSDARTVGVLGSGALARTTLAAAQHVLEIESVTVYSKTEANRIRYASEMTNELGLPVRAVADPSIPGKADLVIVATTSETPVLEATPLQPGATVISVGTNRPHLSEFSAAVIQGNKFLADSRESVFAEVGEFLIPLGTGELTEADFYGEIGQVLSGELAGRADDREIVVFKSTGLAVQDVLTARAVFEQSLALDIGHRIQVQNEG